MRISDWSSDVCSSDLLVRRNTDARIPDGESQTIFRGTADVQDDFTIVREFHCVGEEILQYLFQPQRVCFDAVRRIRGYVRPKRQALFGGHRPECRRTLFSERRNPNTPGLQFDMSRPAFRNNETVINYQEKEN